MLIPVMACASARETEPADDGLRFLTIVAADETACGIATDGKVHCWGANDVQLLGRGGISGSEDRRPTPIVGVGAARSVTLNPVGELACAVEASAGDLYCWGYTPFASSDRPTKVANLTGASAAAAGGSKSTIPFACVVAEAGAVACFGGDGAENVSDGTGSGQLGTGVEPQGQYRYPPQPILGGLSFRDVVAGDRHACGLVTSGAAYCWGANQVSQLGTVAPKEECRTRTGSRFFITWSCSGVPVPVAGSLTFRTLSAGLRVTCGLSTEGAGYCWGSDMGSVPTPVFPGTVLRALAVSAAGRSCCVTTSGRVACVGRNDRGQGGDEDPGAGLHRLASTLDFAAIAV
ncbi:MAG: RCC1 domain-containing protein, partial [Gemmatimonadaceae bacterium]